MPPCTRDVCDYVYVSASELWRKVATCSGLRRTLSALVAACICPTYCAPLLCPHLSLSRYLSLSFFLFLSWDWTKALHWYFSWTSNGSLSVNQALFSSLLIGSKIIPLSLSRFLSDNYPFDVEADVCTGYMQLTDKRVCLLTRFVLCMWACAETQSRCSPGSLGSTQWRPCSRLLRSLQLSAPKRSSAARCCQGPCPNFLRLVLLCFSYEPQRWTTSTSEMSMK